MEMSQLDSDLRLPPRKRLLAGYKKLNSNGIGSSSSSSSTSNGSSSSASRYHSDLNQSPEELVEAARSAAAKAVKAAKAARAMANEKALISSKAIAAAKRALELVDSFPKEAMADCKEKKHVSLDHLSSKGQLRYEEEDLGRRLQRAIDRMYPPKVLGTREENGRKSKKQKMNKNVAEGGSRVASYMNGNAGVVDSDSSYDGLESSRKSPKAFKEAEVDSIPTPGKEKAEEQRRGRVKLKKLPMSICSSRDQENGISCKSPVPVAQPQEDGVVPVIPGTSSRKCQDLKAPECVKQNEGVRS